MARTLDLVFAASSSPLSLDQLVEWGVARPSELWGFLESGRRDGGIVEDGERPGHFSLRDEAKRVAVLQSATPADWAPLLRLPALIPELAATARTLRRQRHYRAAGALFGLLLTLPPEAFPGGEREWLALLLENIRTFRLLHGIAPAQLDRALAIAEAAGDVSSQAVLLAARGLGALHAGQLELARAFDARARHAAQAAAPEVRAEVYTYLAVGLVTQGREQEGVGALEELLGDVPDQAVASGDMWLLVESPVAAVPFGYLAHAYCYTGQTPRGLELLHRLLTRGEELGRPNLVAEAHVHLALLHVRQGSLQARTHAEAAWRYFGEQPDAPVYAWVSAAALAWVLGVDGRLEEMRRLFETGLQLRARTGIRFFPGQHIAYEIARQIGPRAFDGVAGFDLRAEAEEDLAAPNIYAAATAHRFVAWHLAHPDGGANPQDPRIATLLDRAVALVREAGAVTDLPAVLAEAAAHAERCGNPARALELRNEERRARGSLPHAAAGDEGLRRVQLAAVVLGLGRLGAHGGRREGFWGDVAARLGQGLGAERIALAELQPEPRLLAFRGGDNSWQDVVRELAARPPQDVRFEDGGGVRRVVVPFCAEGLGRCGVVVMENRHAPALVSEQDVAVLSGLGVQLGILLGNVALWQELTAARERLEQENRYFRESPQAATGGRLVAHSAPMRQVLDLVARAAPTTTTVLVHGETGVGKELVAREVHRQSERREGPFIAVHIASLAPGLVASGLFGHERGAFTGATEQQKGRFELADRGTIFLDEIGELSPEDQVRLLRVLQEGTFERVGGTRPVRSDFRLVAATNRDLGAEVKAGRFREDLYFRLNVFPVRVPPLRERPEEIPTLALFFMERFARNVGRSFEGISEADMERLVAYPWPGNVRELEHLVERAVLLSDGPRLRIPPLDGAAPPARVPAPAAAEELVSLEEAERRHIVRVLRHAGGRITGAGGAAEILKLKPSTLNWKIKDLGLREALEQIRKGGAPGTPPRRHAS